MGDRTAKDALFAEFAAVGKALGSPKRLELLDLLAQAPHSVEELARAADLGLSTCSAHLQRLLAAGLVSTRRDGTRIWYSLAGDDVAGLFANLRSVAQRHRPHVEPARRTYLGPDDTEQVDVADLLRRAEAGDIIVLDVRPAREYAAGHLPGAVSIPLEELADRLTELPMDREVVAYCRGAYCAMAHEAVRLLTAHGRRARRATNGVLEWRVAGLPVQAAA
ncbi:MAG TPA: metalloregulator ArsR/SmtB family transcription factor [Micromonosporaceae bacterium]|nr:metalloregulator ArsR/SmtB family transcription factor [Micromonosporaceae bacterium]